MAAVPITAGFLLLNGLDRENKRDEHVKRKRNNDVEIAI
jgi:hypothetical protein